jgi:hypothetical protein
MPSLLPILNLLALTIRLANSRNGDPLRTAPNVSRCAL